MPCELDLKIGRDSIRPSIPFVAQNLYMLVARIEFHRRRRLQSAQKSQGTRVALSRANAARHPAAKLFAEGLQPGAGRPF